jgi:hypothetical protein
MAKVERQQAEDIIVEEEDSAEETHIEETVKRERRQSNVSEGSVKKDRSNSADAKDKVTLEETKEEDGDKYFSTLSFKDLPLSE